jgi:hypothetical protein
MMIILCVMEGFEVFDDPLDPPFWLQVHHLLKLGDVWQIGASLGA